MAHKLMLLLALTSVLLFAVQVHADWDPSQPAKWVQMPDEDVTGIDVLATSPFQAGTSLPGKILADDWLCRSTGLVTDIHLWGSWLNDKTPFSDPPNNGDPGAVTFKLSIHKDIPVDADNGVLYSRPGEELWSMIINPTAVRPWKTGVDEIFWDPNTNEVLGNDTVIWQYNFDIDPALAFEQKGTTDRPIVYWLDVQAVTEDPDALWGWKTSRDHWNDDAVFGDNFEFGGPVDLWRELIYPDGHQLAGKSIDLAFVITPEPTTLALIVMGSLALLKRRRV